MNTRIISLTVLLLTVCTMALAAEYKSPEVGLKKTSPSHKETKMAEFKEDYKVEGADKTERLIASENEPSEREPSSVVAKEKKPAVDDHKAEDPFAPQPWLYRNKYDAAN